MITDVRRPSTKNRAALGQVKGRSKRRKPFEMLIIHGESQLRLVSPNKKKIVLGAEHQEQVLVLRTCGKWEWSEPTTNGHEGNVLTTELGLRI